MQGEMVAIPSGTFAMGSDDFYIEERPVHRVRVEQFQLDKYAVSNRDFAEFVQATGYRTTAETPLESSAAVGLTEEQLAPGSLVFHMTEGPVPLDDVRAWWRFVPGASWRQPEGPGSSLDGRQDHPVVHVTYFDALAYANWAGKSLPNEKEWEFAARAGATTEFPWGNELRPGGQAVANTWHGDFPYLNDRSPDAFLTVRVDAFEPSAYGAYNMIGNVWEWTSEVFRGQHNPDRSCCAPDRPMRGQDRLVLKGGSHLCSASYCERYRPAARSPQEAGSSASHIGFRCVVR
ncbi:MAG: formylglycine-generating enzyme family protein [Hyphomicrobiales bacterium]|nr:formylglycine-generating enzyme family protein [Hyphomicrobiales bacterium]